MKPLLYFAIGLLTGFLAAMFGLGGGFLLVPLMNLMGVEIHKAVGTSSAAVVFTALSSTFAYTRQGRVLYRTGLMLALPAMVGAYAGALLTSYITPKELKLIFGITLIVVAYRTYQKKTAEPKEVNPKTLKLNGKVLVLGAFFSGITSGLLGIGGGVINVPLLVWLGVPIHYAVATSSFAIILTSTISALKHYSLGNVETTWLVLLVPGLITGAQVGAKTARKIKAENLKGAFAILMAVLAVRMILKAVLPGL